MKLVKATALALSLLLALVANGAWAQYDEDVLPQQGDISIGAALSGITGGAGLGSGIYISDVEGSRITTIALAGDYLFTNEFAFGLELGFGEEKVEGDTFRTTILGARLTYFFRPPSGVTLPYVRVGFVSIDPEGEGSATGFSAGGGVLLFLTPAAALDLSANYISLQNGGKADGFSARLGLNFWLR